MKEIFAKIDFRKILQYALYALILLIFQNMLLSQLRPLGVCCMFLPAAVTAVAMYEDSLFSTVFALILGIYADMAFVENTVMFTLTFPAIAFGIGFFTRFFINRQFMAYMIAAACSLVAVAVVQLLRTATADAWSPSMIPTALLQVLWSLPPAALVYFWPASRAKG